MAGLSGLNEPKKEVNFDLRQLVLKLATKRDFQHADPSPMIEKTFSRYLKSLLEGK